MENTDLDVQSYLQLSLRRRKEGKLRALQSKSVLASSSLTWYPHVPWRDVVAVPREGPSLSLKR